jgi:hypothetical protein
VEIWIAKDDSSIRIYFTYYREANSFKYLENLISYEKEVYVGNKLNNYLKCMCSIENPTRCTWMYMHSVSLYIFALRVAGAICTHPQERKL